MVLNNYSGYRSLNESRSLIDGNTEWILSLGSIKFMDKHGNMIEVPCREFTKVVDMALGRIESRFPYISPYIMHSKVMYVPYVGGAHSTMSVDDQKNLWINMPFMYNVLDMNVDKVMGILFHELMHNVLDHLKTMAEMFPVSKRMAMGPAAWEMEKEKLNICADMEVNCDMVADGIVSDTFWDKIGGVYDTDYTGKMLPQIYGMYGDILFKKYTSSGLGEKALAVLKAFEEYAEEVSKPGATERDKERAKEELEKKLDDILGKDPSKKEKPEMTIKSALIKVKNMLKDFDDIVAILDELIDIYIINPERFSSGDLDMAITAINRFESALNKNCGRICSSSTHLSEVLFKYSISKCADIFRNNTRKVFEGKSTLSKDEIDLLNFETASSIWYLLEDDDAKESSKEEIEKKRKDLEEKKRKDLERKEAEKRKKEMKDKKDKKMRHLLFGLFKKLANISNLISIGRVSVETSELSKEIALAIRDLTDIPIESITSKDVAHIAKKCSDLGGLLSKDLMNLYDDGIIKTPSTELDAVAKNAAGKTREALEIAGDSSSDISDKRNAVVSASAALNKVGELLRTTKKMRPSDEFKAAYKDELKRLTKILKEYGKDALKEHLIEMGYGPLSAGGTGDDVRGTDMDPEMKK